MTCMHQGPPPKEWNCSLERDHDGPHVARTAVGRFTWPNDAEPAGPPDALNELDRLHAAATAGEWEVRSYQEPSGEFSPAPSWEVYGEDTLALTAALHNAWPAISARLRAAEAEVERLRGALRGMLATHDLSHSEECNAWVARDEDVCRCEEGCAEPHCDCGATEARDKARAALGEP